MADSYRKVLDSFTNAGLHVDDRGGRASCQAPGHSVADRSVSVKRSEGRTLMFCHSGHDLIEVLQGVGLQARDLFDNANGITYAYPDGRKVHRSPAKAFRQSGNTKGKSLYRVERLPDDLSITVHVVEGEQDVHAVEAVGGRAVCSAMGAGNAHLFDWSPLAGRPVVIVADKDSPGQKHAADIRGLVADVAASVAVVEALTGKDAADHIAAGHGLDELVLANVPASIEPARPKVFKASELRPAAQPRWLAKGRLPRAAIAILVGDEGIGKSLLWVWLVGAVTTGKALPEFGIPEREPAHVLLVLTEDDWSSTVRPRLEVAGADLSRVMVICTDTDGSGAPEFPRDMDLVLGADPVPALVIVDAWLDTVPGRLSVKDPQQARQALHPWKEAATVTDAAIMLLTHTNRMASANARDKYGATSELRKKARMTLFAQQDDEGNLVVGPEKANTAGSVAASIFTIDPIEFFEATEDHDGTVPLLRYIGESDVSARDMVADVASGDGTDQRHALDDLLLRLLADGPVGATKAQAATEAAGFSTDQTKRAKKRIGAKSVRDSFGGGWVWQLDQGSAPKGAGHVDDRGDSPKGAPKDLYHVESAPFALFPGQNQESSCSLEVLPSEGAPFQGSQGSTQTDTPTAAPFATCSTCPELLITQKSAADGQCTECRHCEEIEALEAAA